MKSRSKRCLPGHLRRGTRAAALAGAAAALLFAAAGSAFAAFDAYMKIPGIQGASGDAAHAGWIGVSRVVSGNLSAEAAADREASAPSVSELTARKAGAGQTAARPGGAPNAAMATGMESGKRQHQPFVITRKMDAASPKLMQACASGRHFPRVEVDQMANGRLVHFLLGDVTIASDVKGGRGPNAMETITLNFTKITMQ